jgi:type I restriction enzyme R subunit
VGAETARTKASGYDDYRIRVDASALERLAPAAKAVDMAVIVSPGQNEIEDMKKLGLDIVPHRKRMAESQPPLDERFKDPADPLSLVFVCAMWLTGSTRRAARRSTSTSRCGTTR